MIQTGTLRVPNLKPASATEAEFKQHRKIHLQFLAKSSTFQTSGGPGQPTVKLTRISMLKIELTLISMDKTQTRSSGLSMIATKNSSRIPIACKSSLLCCD